MAIASTKPDLRPANPQFSCGPCTKHPGWSLAALAGAHIGRSHRAPAQKAALAEVIARSRSILGLPDDWKLAIMPGSDTGAFEAAMWSMLGARGVDVVACEAFSEVWAVDVAAELMIDHRIFDAPYGQMPDLSQIDFGRDVVLCWNATSGGVRFPNGDFIPADREGLVLCDATSAAFAMELPFDKLDVVTWSWQKVLGGEAAHGMLALSPRAVARLEGHKPAWPLPKIFRLTRGGKLIDGVFAGETINTPSMLCVEDALDALRWAESVGGLKALIARTDANFAAVTRWIEQSDWAAFLVEDPATRSPTSICLAVNAPWFTELAPDAQSKAAKRIAALLEEEAVAFDIASYRDAPPGLRFWGGATVQTSDIEAMLPWLDWAAGQVCRENSRHETIRHAAE